jgi:hypothetical protein
VIACPGGYLGPGMVIEAYADSVCSGSPLPPTSRPSTTLTSAMYDCVFLVWSVFFFFFFFEEKNCLTVAGTALCVRPIPIMVDLIRRRLCFAELRFCRHRLCFFLQQ